MFFGENGIIQRVFCRYKKTININERDIEEIVLSQNQSYGKDSFEYFIEYRHKGNAFRSPLCVKLPQMNVYVKYTNLLVNDKKN